MFFFQMCLHIRSRKIYGLKERLGGYLYDECIQNLVQRTTSAFICMTTMWSNLKQVTIRCNKDILQKFIKHFYTQPGLALRTR
jgi:hypothetical protein